jgi:hypothetical protein
MKKFLFMISAVVLLTGCAKNNDLTESEGIRIRIENISQYDFRNVMVNPLNEETSFGNINAGGKSGYEVFLTAYRYAYVRVEINNNIYTLQPIDYVGEKKLSKGKYTYQIGVASIQDQHGSLTLALKKDN